MESELARVFTSMGVGFLMIQYGLRYKRLQWRHVRRRCASCGRRLESRACGRCGSP